MAAALLVAAPAALILPHPYRMGVVLLMIGLTLRLVIPDGRPTSLLALPRRGSVAATLAGAVMLVQSVAIWIYMELTARSHELMTPLPQILAMVAKLVGADSAGSGNTVSLHSMRQIHQLGATWELYIDPVTFCYLAGSLAIFTWFTWYGGWRRKEYLRGSAVLALAMLVWLPLRAGLLMAIYLNDVLRTPYDAELDAMRLLWNSWLHLGLLVGPVAICWRFLPNASSTPAAAAAPATAETRTKNPSASTAAWRMAVPPMSAGIAAALVVFGIAWDPVGQRQAGRVLVEEYHPDPERIWEPTRKPFDTQWYGSESGYNYYCIYDYLSRFYAMSRSTAPLNAAMLANHDVLLVKVPTRHYSAAEIAAMRDFVRNGGGLLLIGEHTNVFHTSDYLNPVARVFGFEFRDDCLFGIDSVYEQQYEPPLIPHPIVQNLEQMDFATSCSIDPLGSRGRAVIRDTGLKSLMADYHSDNFYPLPENRAEMRYGTFVQLWSTRYGDGRVTAFTDSTIFSNFCTFDRGKAELMLGMVEWLNHRGSRTAYPSLLLTIGTVLLAATIWWGRSWGTDLTLFVASGLLGSSLAIGAVQQIHREAMPLPKPLREIVQASVDRTVCDAPLSRNGFVDGTNNGFGIFERWLLRLGYFTSRRQSPALFDADLVVLPRPNLTADDSYRDALLRYVADGGKVIVLDSARSDSTTNDLLEPFGLSTVSETSLRGLLRTEPRWPAVPVDKAVAVAGGKPFAWLNGQPVGTHLVYGRGSVTLVGFADRFCDARMGGTGDVVPDASLQRVFDLQFGLIRWIVEGADPPSLDQLGTSRSVLEQLPTERLVGMDATVAAEH